MIVGQDKWGNEYSLRSSTLYLQLRDGVKAGRALNLGRISDGTWYIVREKKHFFRKGEAWGVNIWILENAEMLGIKRLHFNVIDDKGVRYTGLMSVANVLASEPDYLHFKKKGFELQCFVPRTALARA